ncbi:hypothetical protein Tco_0389273 [Tanacetum coccineum]
MENHCHWELITSGGWLLASAHRLYQLLAFGSVVDDYCNDCWCCWVVVVAAGVASTGDTTCLSEAFLTPSKWVRLACSILIGVPVGPVFLSGLLHCHLSQLDSRAELAGVLLLRRSWTIIVPLPRPSMPFSICSKRVEDIKCMVGVGLEKTRLKEGGFLPCCTAKRRKNKHMVLHSRPWTWSKAGIRLRLTLADLNSPLLPLVLVLLSWLVVELTSSLEITRDSSDKHFLRLETWNRIVVYY